MSRHVRELRASSHIADRIDTPIGGAQPRIDANAIASAGNACGIKIQSGQIRLASGSYQNMRGVNPTAAGHALQVHRWPAMLAGLHAGDVALLMDLDPLGLQAAKRDARQ